MKNNNLKIYIVSFALISLAAASVWLVANCFLGKGRVSQAAGLAAAAIRYTVPNAKEMEITGISVPDSTFENEMLTQDEVMGINDQLMALSYRMEELLEGEMNGAPEAEFFELVNHQAKARSFLMKEEPEFDIPRGKHVGWKVRVDFGYVTASGVPMKSQYWFFMDKNMKFIYESFEVPQI